MKYQVTITETLSRKISVEAPTAEIAEEQVRGLYRDEDIVLGSSDFCYFNVDVCGEEAKPFYLSTEGDFSLYYGDCMELLPLFNDKVDMVFADPPYFLSKITGDGSDDPISKGNGITQNRPHDPRSADAENCRRVDSGVPED